MALNREECAQQLVVVYFMTVCRFQSMRTKRNISGKKLIASLHRLNILLLFSVGIARLHRYALADARNMNASALTVSFLRGGASFGNTEAHSDENRLDLK